MNVLVTGGTGFVGRNVARELVATGHSVTVLARHPPRPSSTTPNDIAHRPGDILDRASLNDACAGMDAIIHLVGIISEVGSQTFEAVHTRGTENILAAARSNDVRRFIQMSALGTRANAVSRYHKSKWAAEEAVRQSPLEWTIFRPSIIYGPGDGFVNLFARIIRFSPIVPVFGTNDALMQPIAVANVAKAFGKACTEPRAVRRTFTLSGSDLVTLADVIDTILRVTRRHRLKLRIPLPVVRVQAAVAEFVFKKLLRRRPPLNRDQVIMLQENNAGDGSEADELFGLTHEPFEVGIARYLTP